METQQKIKYQKVRKADYDAVEKFRHFYHGVSDTKRGSVVALAWGKEEYVADGNK